MMTKEASFEFKTEFYDMPKLICKITDENKKLRKLAFERCPLHKETYGEASNYLSMFANGKCEGYCRNNYDDEPLDDCKECIIHEYYED